MYIMKMMIQNINEQMKCYKDAPRGKNTAYVELGLLGGRKETLKAGRFCYYNRLPPLYLINGFGRHISVMRVFSV